MMIFAETALLPDGWADNVLIKTAPSGRIIGVDDHVSASAANKADHRVGIILPAPVNAHSHAFQRAMAGLTERRGPDTRDSFWTWRRLMFRFLEALQPEHLEAITTFVQMEMLEAGYATNVEFHYVHHQPDGTPYDNLAELSERCVAAAHRSGIGLTLLPVLYQYGGCDKRALSAGQVRFGNDLDRFQKLHQAAARSVQSLPEDAGLGVAPHSLRAVDPDLLPNISVLAGEGPVHMHLAEQIAEVDEVVEILGQRPVELVLDRAGPSEQWCLIHCTQMLPHETKGLAETGAIAGLCPITESSLGDGIFDGVNWLNHGGKIAVGSDSNIRISLSEELRTLDYSQRLRDRSRAALATGARSTGRRLFEAVLEGGALAAQRNTGNIVTGAWADLLALDRTHVDLGRKSGDLILDTFIFAGDDRMVTDVWSAGRHLVTSGQHVKRDEIVSQYAKAIAGLGDTL